MAEQNSPLASSERKLVEVKFTIPGLDGKGMIMDKFTCKGEGISPQIKWESVPQGTKSLALVIYDPDAPTKMFVHWVAYNISPEQKMLPENIKKGKKNNEITQGLNELGELGYVAPCPPNGETHRYVFDLYALNEKLTFKDPPTKSDLESIMNGNLIGYGQLIAKFAK
jgi:hypothetical protein